MTEEQKAAESKFGRCPKNHALPHRTNKGNCTPLFCAGSTPGNVTLTKVKKEAKLAVQDLGEVGDVDEAEDVMIRQSKNHTKHLARMKYVNLPEFRDAKERETWVENKKQELVPLAIADLEIQLKLGDTQEREKARKEVLDMTGHSKREGAGSTSPLIMLVGVTGNLADNPWVRKVDPKDLPPGTQVINGETKK